MSYSVDTSALLNWWVRYYPPDVFPSLQMQMETLADDGQFLSIDEVQRELQKKDDALHRWTLHHPNMVVAMDAAIQTQARDAINGYPSLIPTKSVMGGSAGSLCHRAGAGPRMDGGNRRGFQAQQATHT